MTEEKDTHILYSQLEDYVSEGPYPFHMPGHKRRMEPAPGLPYAWDVTEVPGTDDLHDARGILREAMRRTAELWGADRTWYLVNGSTCGLLAGIRALARPGDEVLCARNCHKAVFHALALAGYRVHWILPEADPSWGICRGLGAGQVEAALRRHPLARALILTSPTYEGVLSDVSGICAACHARGLPVLVDEAHGAHLMPLSERAGFPAGALACGADLVVQSPHKTLPSLTQTALLHLAGSRVDPGRIEEELDIFETSSPSYPLLASLDGCTGLLGARGEELFAAWALRIGRFDSAVRDLSGIRILGRRTGSGGDPQPAVDWDSAAGGLYDPGKILIDARRAGLSGRDLAALLRRRFHMETEMSSEAAVLAMTSPCDAEDALDRLAAALRAIDCGGEPQPPCSDAARRGGSAPGGTGGPSHEARGSLAAALLSLRPVSVCTPAQAAGQAAEEVPLMSAAGRICAEYLYFYPPGIPFLVPGEAVTREHCRLLLKAEGEGIFPSRKAAGDGIRCLRE